MSWNKAGIPGISILILSAGLFFFLNRKSPVPAGIRYVNLPDSCWLRSEIYLDQLRKDIAWSVVKNGDWQNLFKEDTSNSLLLSIIKSPADFSLVPDQPLILFSRQVQEDYVNGILFRLESGKAVEDKLSGDSLSPAAPRFARTPEGVWMFNEHNLLFIQQGPNDSLQALTFFAAQHTLSDSTSAQPDSADNPRIRLHLDLSCHSISKMYPFLNDYKADARLSFEEGWFTVNWSTTGKFNAVFKNNQLYRQANGSGLSVAGSIHPATLRAFISSVPALDSICKKNSDLYTAALTALNNPFYMEWNGWHTAKQSYYVSEMNEEFELVLKKKDSSYQEPVYRLVLEQPDDTSRQHFLSALQKQGLIASSGKNRYKVIPGNFESDVSYDASNTITVQNKNSRFPLMEKWSFEKAFYICLYPFAVKQFSGQKESFYSVLHTLDSIHTVRNIMIIGKSNGNELSGICRIEFTGTEHVFLQFLKTTAALYK